ncbi:CRTAC1 family protein [Flavivirga aquimarina]|uniref:CRTAC1 family protein n=1 Tax=Flavivirga aquimarina TaxID=2027862 RepID=A0ABT8WDQ4_9FLAO|nr:CRTAC1 family protein [Flavivirga aquimarina]MDO5971290.1 CRTAC1 family protein [Flavivirga aquimarina]
MLKLLKRVSKTLLFALVILGCNKEESTIQELLKKTAKEQFFVPENDYASSVRVAYFDSIIKTAPANKKTSLNLLKAEELLYAGKTKNAIEILETLWDRSLNGPINYNLEPREEKKISSLLAVAYLRMGEQQNCLHHHEASASCIIPIGPKGYHHVKEGSRKAIVMFEKMLSYNSHDFNSRWLLNIAYMTLGEYPDGVPEKWVIPESVFKSDYPLKKFRDIAPKLGLNINELSGGIVVDDFNNDDLLDVLVSSWFPSHLLRYFVNNGDGNFTEKTQTAGVTEIGGGLNMVQADYNNDGFLDVFVLRGAWLGKLGKHPNSLLRNNGDNTFTDVTIEAGLLSFHPTQTATWADFNNDGWIDLFIGNESEPNNMHPCELYVNNGDGTFSNKTKSAGLTVSDAQNAYYVKGVTTVDFDNDGWMDIYVSNYKTSSKNLLFKNTGMDEVGEIHFKEVGTSIGIGETFSSFPTWSFDYDNDGWMDIFVAGYKRSGYGDPISADITKEYLGFPHQAETMRLYKNSGGTFSDVSSKVGLNKIGYAMGANYGDLDNDGYLDIYLSTGETGFESIIPNRVFRNSYGKTFQDVTTAGGFGHLQKGHAVSFSDIDNDGDQDIHVVMGGAFEGDNFFNSVYENPYQNENSWVKFILEGTKANRSAIGSKLAVTIIEDEHERIIFHTISSGGSFGSSTLRAEIGLSKASEIIKLELTWAGSGTRQIFENIKLNTFYKIIEGNPQVKEIHLRSIPM